jgi:hypothetical protein
MAAWATAARSSAHATPVSAASIAATNAASIPARLLIPPNPMAQVYASQPIFAAFFCARAALVA